MDTTRKKAGDFALIMLDKLTLDSPLRKDSHHVSAAETIATWLEDTILASG